MKLVKLGLAEKTIDEKVAQGNAIKTGLTGNANFPSTTPTAASLGTTTTALANAKIARDNAFEAAKAATVALHVAEDAYDAAVTQIAASCEATANGDAAKLEGAGFEMRATATPINTLTQVQNLRLTSNTYAGKLFARWDPVRGAKSYEVQICADPPTEENFRPLTPATAGTYVIADLPSMTRQWLRVRGVSKKSVGPWSQMANKVVP
jgi:hypothetical protein